MTKVTPLPRLSFLTYQYILVMYLSMWKRGKLGTVVSPHTKYIMCNGGDITVPTPDLIGYFFHLFHISIG